MSNSATSTSAGNQKRPRYASDSPKKSKSPTSLPQTSTTVTNPINVERPRLDQQRILKHIKTHQTIIVACGRRWGKTTMSAIAAIAYAEHGNHVAWIAPTYKNARPLWDTIKRTCKHHAHLQEVERRATFPSGGTISIFSADNPDSILGNAFHLVVLDEAARIAELVFYETVLPTVADYDGTIICISTPKGKNWFWREWERGQTPNSSVISFRAPTSANPNIRIQRAAELAKTRISTNTYLQEWEAHFIDDIGGVFHNVRACVQPRQPHTSPCIIGIDWGKAHDYTVQVAIDPATKRVVAVERFNRIDYVMQVERVVAFWERHGRGRITAERNSIGEVVIELLKRKRIPVRPFLTTQSSKQAIVDTLAFAIEHRQIGLPDEEWLIRELENYEGTKTSSGGYKYGAPQGLHDDGVMALMLAWNDCIAPPSSAVGAFA